MSQQVTLESRQALARAKFFLEKAKNARAEEKVDFEALSKLRLSSLGQPFTA
jgi:hypothetical protein